ncbi:hypothetical protein ACTXT7_014745 [Hymenolepis weldensis]
MAASTSIDAQIPAALALAKLSFSFAMEFLRKLPLILCLMSVVSRRRYFRVMITALVGIYVRTRTHSWTNYGYCSQNLIVSPIDKR